MSVSRVEGRFLKFVLQSVGEVSSVFEQKVREMIEQNGIEEIDDDGWYETESWANALHQVEEEIGAKTSEQVGAKIVENLEEVSDMGSMEETIEISREIQADSYQNFTPETAGQFRHEYTENGDSRISLYGGWPYPEAYTYGIAKGVVRATEGVSASDIEETETREDEVYAYVIRS